MANVKLTEKPLISSPQGSYNIIVSMEVDGTESLRRVPVGRLPGADSPQRLGQIETILDVTESGSSTSMRELHPDRYVSKSIYNVNTKTTYGNDNGKAHAFFSVTPGTTYYVTGNTPGNTNGHPLCAFYDADNALISKAGTDTNTVYNQFEVVAPSGAVTMVVNKNTTDQKKVAAFIQVVMTGSLTIDSLIIQANNTEDKVAALQDAVAGDEVLKGPMLSPTTLVTGKLCKVTDFSEYSGGGYSYAFYEVSEGKKYFVTGRSATNTNSYPLGGWYDENDVLIDSFGIDPSTDYREELVTAPPTAVKMLVNSAGQWMSIVVVSGLVQMSAATDTVAAKAYNLNMADAMIRMDKKNPFTFAELDKGYVSFIFDDLCDDIDSVASLFEQYGYPLTLAAIPAKLYENCSGLSATRGNFTVGMQKLDVVRQVLANGGEVMTHNQSPVVTAENQTNYDFMHEYFVTRKEELESVGIYPRGIIRAGGSGAINRSAEIDRWLIGNYEYANMGTLPQYNWDRTTIQKSQADLKADILSAKNNKTWLRFMCHSYDFGEGETFTGEADLIELLTYCQSIGIDVVTVGYIFDHFSSTVMEERLKVLEGGGS